MASSCISTICQACQALFKGKWRGHTSNKYVPMTKFEKRAESGATIELQHHNMLQLELSASNGCSMCVLDLREFERRNGPERLRSLREADYPGAQIWIWCSEPDYAIFHMQFNYPVGTSPHSHWCFMLIRVAQSDQGIATI